jgi:ATP-dependent phosphofructokinase / diphosphate-dependent phosphofructokinase
MSATLPGKALVAQSGGPTAVINASACGVIQEARRAGIRHVYGANDGILGVLQEDLFDISAETAETIEGLRWTPAAAIGSCRHKLGSLEKDGEKYQRVLEVFRAHDIRYFFYIGGNDSMDTAAKVNRLAAEQGYELRVMGVPKTIDNDLPITDHCPGYGSVAKYVATATMEAGRDTEAMHTFDAVTILEVMGRDTGWIAAAAGLARRSEVDAPHLIYVPEIPFTRSDFLADVEGVLGKRKGAFIVVGEGLKGPDGRPIKVDEGEFAADAFGHLQMGGVAGYLTKLVEKELRVKARYNKPGTCQRNASHVASATDRDEAYECGQAAVRRAVAGESGSMVTLVRNSDGPYRCTTGVVGLEEIANRVKPLPRTFMDERGTGVTAPFRTYATPLVKGQVSIPAAADGLPQFVRFRRSAIPRMLPAFEVR